MASTTNTNANIAMVRSDGTFKSIYLHWDGEPGCAGQKLLEHYNSSDDVHDMLLHGDLSSLGECYELCDYYFEHEGEVWDDVMPITKNQIFISDIINGKHNNLKEENFLYVWDDSGEMWYVMDGSKVFQPLEAY